MSYLFEGTRPEGSFARGQEIQLVREGMDPIADLLTRIRNGYLARHEVVTCPHSKLKEGIVQILTDEGFLQRYEVVQEGSFKELKVYLRYDSKGRPVLREIKRVSKPGLRVYRQTRSLKPVRSGMGTQILTTSKGLMTDREARKRRLGGEVLCEVW